MSDELKACPFCENAAYLVRGNVERFNVVCGNGDCGVRTIFYRTAEDAVAAWNRRATSAAGGEER